MTSFILFILSLVVEGNIEKRRDCLVVWYKRKRKELVIENKYANL